MNLHSFNGGVKTNLIRNWAWNAHINHPRILAEYRSPARHEYDLDRVQKVQGAPAIVIGSGQSLDEALPYLHGWRGAVFASPSHAKILDHAGRLPEWLVAIDTSCDVPDKLDGPEYARTTLITHPSIDPGVLEMWQWDKKYFLMEDTGEWSDLQSYVFPWIKVRLVNEGCVMNTCISLAWLMGYDPIFLMGADFGFANNKIQGMRMKKRGKYLYWPDPPQESGPPKEIMMEEHGVQTTPTNLFYKNILLANWKMQSVGPGKTHIINCSPNGILRELPTAEPKAVIEQQGQGFIESYPSPRKIAEIVDAYTVPNGMYARIEAGRGAGMEMAQEAEDSVAGMEAQIAQKKEVLSRWTKTGEEWSRDTSQ